MAIEDDHRHCKVCGKVCAADAETCSKACRLKREELQRNRRNSIYLMYVLIAVVVLAFVLSYVR